MSDSVTSWTVAHQAPLSMEFSRQEYWSGLPFPSPGDLPDTGIEPGSPTLQADALPSEIGGVQKKTHWGMALMGFLGHGTFTAKSRKVLGKSGQVGPAGFAGVLNLFNAGDC